MGGAVKIELRGTKLVGLLVIVVVAISCIDDVASQQPSRVIVAM